MNEPVTAWTSDELDRIAAAEELRIASLQRDGMMREPVTIWVVRINDDIYVRSVNDRITSWFRGAQERKEGRIWVGGVEKDVAFVKESAPDINDQINAAYRAKYQRYASSLINDITCPEARSTTTKLVPL